MLMCERLLPSSYVHRIRKTEWKIQPDKFPYDNDKHFIHRYTNQLWFKALNLSHFDSYDVATTVSFTLDLKQVIKVGTSMVK